MRRDSRRLKGERYPHEYARVYTLQLEAENAANHRGHNIAWSETFKITAGWGSTGQCRDCPAWVQVETNPAPNSIDVGGPAVATNCHNA